MEVLLEELDNEITVKEEQIEVDEEDPLKIDEEPGEESQVNEEEKTNLFLIKNLGKMSQIAKTLSAGNNKVFKRTVPLFRIRLVVQVEKLTDLQVKKYDSEPKAKKRKIEELQKNKYLQCEECGKKLKNENSLVQHVDNIHLNIKNFACDLCNVRFGSNTSLSLHKLKCHPEYKNTGHFCSHCDFKTMCKPRLKEHVDSKHLKIKMFSCEICNTNFGFKGYLFRHVKLVHEKKLDKKFKCTKCNYETEILQYLVQHIDSVHDKIIEFKCDQCSYKSTRKNCVLRHTNSVHKNLKPHKCELCDMTFGHTWHVKKHVKHIHSK